MPQITVKGHICKFDECDREIINSRKWSIRCGWRKYPYLCSTKGELFHRLVLNAPKGLLVDHKNHNTLDNRRSNIRLCTRSQNMWNRKRTSGTSQYKGVCWHKWAKKWYVQLNLNDKIVYNKVFDCEHEAALAYNKKAKEIYGEYAYLNKIKREKSL